MRATRETELAQQYPMHVVCEWIGNSTPVALKHFLRVTDADFSRAAVEPTTKAKIEDSQSVEVGAAESGAVDAPDSVQNRVQQPAASVGKASQEMQKALADQGLKRRFPAIHQALLDMRVPPTGFEPVLPD